MTTFEAPTLFDSAVIVSTPKPSKGGSFARFCRRNPWFLPRLAEMAYEARSRGARRISMKMLFEELRGEVDDQGAVWRLNNSWTAVAARRLVELYPDLDGLFEMRGRK